MLGWPGSSPRRKRPSGSITICPLSTASSILPIFTSDLDRCAVPGLLDVGDGHHAKSAGLIPEGPLRSTRKRRRVGFSAFQPIDSGRPGVAPIEEQIGGKGDLT